MPISNAACAARKMMIEIRLLLPTEIPGTESDSRTIFTGANFRWSNRRLNPNECRFNLRKKISCPLN
jgi:hypothetical protein